MTLESDSEDEGSARAVLKPEEGEVSDSGASSDDSDAEEDGYGDDLIGDEEDRKRLEQMTEWERTQVLHERMQRRALMARKKLNKRLKALRKLEKAKNQRNSCADSNTAAGTMGDNTGEEGGACAINDGDHHHNDRQKMLIRVNRLVYTQTEFDEGFEVHPRPKKALSERAKEYRKRCTCLNILYKLFPFLKMLRDYSIKEDFVYDLIAGLTVGVMHIPHGMAYGMLANLTPVYGLYVSFFPTLLYFFLGTSRHISLGTFAVVSLMTGLVVDKSGCEDVHSPEQDVTTTTLSEYNATSFDVTMDPSLSNTSLIYTTASPGGSGQADSPEVLRCKVGVAVLVAFISGVYQLVVGLLRLGWVTIYLSEPLTRGFTTAAAVYVVTSQARHVLGVHVTKHAGPLALFYTWLDFIKNIKTINVASLILGIIVIVTIYLVKEYVNPKVKAKIKMPVPIELIWVIVGTIVSLLLGLNDRFGVKVVGEIPDGLPGPTVPPMSKLGSVYIDAIGVAVVASANNFAMGKLFARKQGYNLDSNTEFVAYGVTNVACSFFSCYTHAASLSRSLIQEAIGGKTQIAGLVSCTFLLIILYGVGPLFEQLPICILAGIVIVNLKGMFLQFKDLTKLWQISKYDFAIWLVIFFAVCIMTVDVGLFIGVLFAMFTVIFRTQNPYTCLLGRVPQTDIYKDTSVYSGAKEILGIKIYRFEASLYYANSEHFLNKLFQKSGVNPRKLRAKWTKVEKKQKQAEIKRESELRKRHKEGNASENNVEAQLSPNHIPQFYKPSVDISHIVIDCSPMSYLDAPGISTLAQAIDEYKQVNIKVFLAGCKAGIREQLKIAGFFEKIEESSLYLSVHDAVLAAFHSDTRLQSRVRDGSTSPVLNCGSVFELADMNTPLSHDKDQSA